MILRSSSLRRPRRDASGGWCTTSAASSQSLSSATPSSRSRRLAWADLLRRVFGVDALACPRCKTGRLRPIALITKAEIVSRILSHLRLPLTPEQLSDGCTIVYDVTEQPMPGWALGSEPEQPEPKADERGPPRDWDGVDPPSPEQ